MRKPMMRLPVAPTSWFQQAFTAAGLVENASIAPRPAFHTLRTLAHMRAAWLWLLRKRQAHQAGRKLQLVETLQLGEKRFVAMIEAGGARYLIGGGAGQVCLLTRLNQADDQTPDETGGVQAAVVSARPWEQP
jgi:hypothetical protein